MEVSKKEMLHASICAARVTAEGTAKMLSELNFRFAAGFVKEARHMAIVAARAVTTLEKLAAALRAVEDDIAELEVTADGDG